MPLIIPIKDANGNTFNMVVNPAYDSQDDMIKMKSVQKKWRDSFTQNGTPDATKWVTELGTGGSATNSSGALVMANGTTNGSTTQVTSVETFTIPFRVSIGLTLSQRIAGGTFFVEAISVDPVTLAPNGQHTLAWAFDGTNAAQAIYEVQNGGLARLRSAASTIPTTAGAGVYELEAFADEAWFHGGTLDASTGRANSYRRHQQIPDPNALYKVRLRWTNSSAPTSSTNATIQYLSVQDYAELTAEITAGRGNSVAGNAMNVSVVGTVPVNATLLSSTVRMGYVGSAGIWYDESSAPILASVQITGGNRDLLGVATATAFNTATAYPHEIVVSAESDVAGTLWIEASRDNTNWRRVKSVDTTAVAGGGFYAEIVHKPSWRYFRCGYLNGLNNQTRFALQQIQKAS